MPPVRYARSGSVSIAYQVTGEGNGVDLVLAWPGKAIRSSMPMPSATSPGGSAGHPSGCSPVGRTPSLRRGSPSTANRSSPRIEEWVTGSAPAASADRFLTTMLFFDLVDSTPQTAQLGDVAWRTLLDRHYLAVRRELERHAGHEIDTAGDGLLATFDGPARAIRCALAVERADRGIGLTGRAGVHTAEVERGGAAIRGINVAITARICAAAAADEVLVSSTVRELSAGSGIQFSDRGMRALKGVEGQRQLFAAVG